MVTYKNIRIKKAGGGTRLQRVKVLASGKYKFVKNLKKGSRSSPKKGKTKKGGNKSMGKRKFTLPMSIAIPAVATPFVPGKIGAGWASPVQDAQAGRIPEALANYATGWSPIDFRAIQDGRGLEFHIPPYPLMIIAGGILHKVAGYLGINQMLGRANVPIIRV